MKSTKNNPSRVSNNTGWHIEEIPGQAPRRVSHNPRLSDTHPEIAAQWAIFFGGGSHSCPSWQHHHALEVDKAVTSLADRELFLVGCLEGKFPEVATRWHPTKNGDLKPKDVTPKSSKVVFWICDKGHDWKARVWCMVQSVSLASSSMGCPYCYGKRPSKDNNLLVRHPEVAKLWDSKRNFPTLPNQVLPGSKKSFFWRCLQAHEWQATVCNVVESVLAKHEACPRCRKKASEFSIYNRYLL